MPHQLRRIIAINIRNPKDGQPSGRIAELDPRGGVLAVGDNGVGKTTFLRLLPLFYGATPQQILRGTGLSAMLGHTLPDASSAVAFEYERDTDNDLRCAVMHCRPGEDAAQFHIIQGGYQEAFFCDDDNQFVLREDFKTRVESLGYPVSRKLFLHQYRSVILNERLLTKEGGELRRLAALHSLGPAPLYNLDQIAAAMANEKISFRDLQNIVIERVSDTPADASATAVNRELKRNRDDVSRWLDDRDHLAKIMAARPDAEKMLARVSRIKGLHLTLTTLHLAVKQALGQSEGEFAELDQQQAALNQAFEAQKSQVNAALAKRSAEIATTQQTWQALRQDIAAADAKLAHFKAIDVETLAAAQAQETALKNEKVAQERDVSALNAAASGISSDAHQRKASLEKAAQSELSSIDQRLLTLSNEHHSRSEALREAETRALQAQQQPGRLKEIASEQRLILSRLGELKVMSANPLASADILEKRRIAADNVVRLDEESRKASKTVTAVSEESDKARRLADSALARVTVVEGHQTRISNQLADAQARLTPPPGSLLAFLRALPTPLWADSAKLIDPQLLNRCDLEPELADGLELGTGEASMPASGRVSLGGLTLNLQALSLPSWVDMREVRGQINATQGTADGLSAGLQGSRAEAQRLVREMNSALARLDNAIAAEALAETALGNAKATLTRMDQAALADKAEAKRRALAEIEEKQAQAQAIHAEELQLTSARNEAKERIRADFSQQRRRLRDDLAAAQARLEAEKAAVLTRITREIAQVDADMARARAGLGVDPLRLAALEQAIATLAQQLDQIASQRHEVADWQRFSQNCLPTLAFQREACEQLGSHCAALQTQHQTLENQLNTLAQQRRQDLETLDQHKISKRAAFLGLQSLALSLAEFATEGQTPPALQLNWNIADLEREISQRRAALASESDALQKDIRSLRNLMTLRNGPVENWLALKEKEMPNTNALAEHQARCLQAQLLGDWFNPTEHAPYVEQLHQEMNGFMAVASNFVRDLTLFERRVEGFNRELQKALSDTERFERFRDLSVTVRSDVGQIGPMKLLRHMQEVHDGKSLASGLFGTVQGELPGEDEAALIRAFRDILPADGVLRVNLNEQVRLECALVENGQRRLIRSEEDFRAVSSNGNTALITAMFLMGFVQMIRGADSPVRLTWVTDEIGRFDPNNLGAFLHTLAAHRIDVISASPSVDPALARFFPRLCIFEDTGAIATSEMPETPEMPKMPHEGFGHAPA